MTLPSLSEFYVRLEKFSRETSMNVSFGSKKRNVMKVIKTPILMEVVLVWQVTYEHQLYLEMKGKPEILKLRFPLKQRPICLMSIAPVIFRRSNETN